MNIIVIQNKSRMIIEEELNKLLKNETNIITCDYLLEGLDFILEEAAYLSLFDEKKYVIVKNSNFLTSDKLKDEDSDKIINYLNNPNQNTILILTLTEKIDERKKITKLIKEKYQLNIIKELNQKELIQKIINDLKKDKIILDLNAAEYIVQASLNNYDLIYNELEKLKLFYIDKNHLTYEDVVGNVSKIYDENTFKYAEYVVTRNTKKTFEMLKDFKTMKIEPIIILNTVAREYRLMLKCLILKNKGNAQSVIEKELNLRDWMVQKFLRNASTYHINELYDKLEQLANLDVNIKSGKVDKYLGIELFLLDN